MDRENIEDDWGEPCPFCKEEEITHKHQPDEWVCFRCAGAWKVNIDA